MQDYQTLLILKIIVASQRYLPGGRMRIDGPGSSESTISVILRIISFCTYAMEIYRI